MSIDEVKDAVATVMVSLSSEMDAVSSEITGIALDVGLVSFLSLVDRMINEPFVNTGYTDQGGAGQ